MKIKIDRREINQAIKDMDLFPATKKVLAAYQELANKLDKQEHELLVKLGVLRQELTSNLQERQLTDDVSLLINLSLVAEQLNKQADVISTMLEQIEEKKLELKFQYVPMFQEALKDDYREVLQYDANNLVSHLRYEMLKAIADISNEMSSQFEAVAPAIFDVFEVPEVMEKYPALKHAFYKGKYVPYYEEANSVVISKNDIFTAVEAGIVSHPKPEGGNNE